MLWITSQTHFKHGVGAETLFALIQIPGFTANVIKTVHYYPTVKHGDIICDLCMNCRFYPDGASWYKTVVCWCSVLSAQPLAVHTFSVAAAEKKNAEGCNVLSARVDLMLFPEDTSNTGQTSSHHHFVWFFRCSWRLSEVSSAAPVAAPAVIETEWNEVMTVSCLRPSSLDLRHEWSRLKGRVH